MKINNKDFWEKEHIIQTQEVLKNASDFELFMFENAKKRYQEYSDIETVKIFGCGTGREIEAIAQFFHPNKIVASDISEKMIAKCQINLQQWNLTSTTQTLVTDATKYHEPKHYFDLVTILNSMLTYVPNKQDRITIFKNSHQILKPKATLIGTVHNQVGTPAKTLYFKLRSLFSFVLKDKVGNRNTGFNGFKVPGYYYTKNGLIKDLSHSGFKNIEVYSLDEFYKARNISYNRKKGYNNLIFIATKP